VTTWRQTALARVKFVDELTSASAGACEAPAVRCTLLEVGTTYVTYLHHTAAPPRDQSEGSTLAVIYHFISLQLAANSVRSGSVITPLVTGDAVSRT